MANEEKTMNENNSKKKRIGEHEEILKKTLTELDKGKVNVQQIVEKGKEICESIDKSKDSVEKELDVVRNLPSIIPHINNEQWREYDRIIQRNMMFYGTASAFSQETSEYNNQITNIASTASTFPVVTGSSVGSVFNTFSNISEHAFQTKIQKIEIKDKTSENIDLIKNELTSIRPQLVKDFESIILDWSSTADIELKYKVLLNLRLTLFYQLLDNLSPESSYSKTSWFQRSNNRKKRFCQVKFFILGFQDEINIPQSTLSQVNNIASDLQSHFDNMSNFGKYGEKSVLVENSFKEAISSFSVALKLRKQFYKHQI